LTAGDPTGTLGAESPFAQTPTDNVSSKRSRTRPIGIDLFSGAGGMSLGFEQAGFDVVAAVEFDPIHAATHEYDFPECRVLCADATKVRADQLLEQAGVRRGEVDVIFGGPPCQGFSLIGKRLADDPRNTCLFHFQRLVAEIRPRYFVMENVSGLTIGPAREVLEAFIEESKEAGYKVVEPVRVLNAAEFGVPQDRRRLFVYGYLPSQRKPRYPDELFTSPGKAGGPVAQRLAESPLPLGPCVEDAIGDLPDIDGFDELLDSDCVAYRLKGGSKYARTLRGETHDPDDYSYERVYDRAILTASMRAEHTELSRQRFRATEWGDTEPVSRFFKLPPKGVCNTLRAGTATDRGAFTSPRPIHPHHARCISVREAARLHSYPDWFRFHVTKWHGFRQIGNSVPPRLARAVASGVREALGVKPSRPSKSIPLQNDWKLQFDMASAADHFNVSRHVIKPRLRRAK
jgi:DNA (cytosine-5)-methyltransferase 1